MTEPNSAEDYLDTLTPVGVSEQGSFTLNPERAKELLRKYQLPDPRSYCLKLVQWAVCSGASLIEISTHSGSFVLSHNGPDVNRTEVESLASLSLTSGHLANGVYGAMSLNPRSIALSYQGKRYSLLSGEISEVEKNRLTTIGIQGIRRRFLERSSLLSGDLRRRWSYLDLEGPLQKQILSVAGVGSIESGLVTTYCRFAAVPIFLNGKLINAPFDGVPVTSKYDEQQGSFDLSISAGRQGIFRFFKSNSTPGLLAPNPVYFPFECHLIGQPFSASPKTRLSFVGERLYSANGAVYYFSQGGPGGLLFTVADGVVVETAKIYTTVQVSAALDCSDFAQVGIGFGMVKDEPYQKFVSDFVNKVDLEISKKPQN